MVQWFQRSFSFVSAKRIVPFDETNHIFITERYYGGCGARSCMDMELCRPGGAHTGGKQYTTGVYGTTFYFEVVSPCYMFDSAVKAEDSQNIYKE